DDFQPGQGRTDLFDGTSIVIPAGQSDYSIQLFPAAGISVNIYKSMVLSVTSGPGYAIAQDNIDPSDSDDINDAIDLHSWLPIRVFNKVTLFADGTPTAHDGKNVDRNDVIQGSVLDCYFMITLGALADKNPSLVQN